MSPPAGGSAADRFDSPGDLSPPDAFHSDNDELAQFIRMATQNILEPSHFGLEIDPWSQPQKNNARVFQALRHDLGPKIGIIRDQHPFFRQSGQKNIPIDHSANVIRCDRSRIMPVCSQMVLESDVNAFVKKKLHTWTGAAVRRIVLDFWRGRASTVSRANSSAAFTSSIVNLGYAAKSSSRSGLNAS